MSVAEEDGQAEVIVEDNGKGLPQQGRERLTEPYVTTRTKGTGLGLAIVKKIMEDHQGELVAGGWGDGGRPHQSPFCRLGSSRCATSDAADEPMELSPVSHGA